MSTTALVAAPDQAANVAPTLSDYHLAKQARKANRAAAKLSLIGGSAYDSVAVHALGKWSRTEKEICEARLEDALAEVGLTTNSTDFLEALDFRKATGHDVEEAPSLLRTSRRRRGVLENNFWNTLGESVNASLAAEGRAPRTIKAVYDWVHQQHLGSKAGTGGTWAPEEVAKLMEMREVGARWRDIAEELGRYVQDVRCKWRNTYGITAIGRWAEDETERLRKLIKKAVRKRAKSLGLNVKASLAASACAPSDFAFARGEGAPTPPKPPKRPLAPEVVRELHVELPWESIARKLGGRSYKQCRQKWKSMKHVSATGRPCCGGVGSGRGVGATRKTVSWALAPSGDDGVLAASSGGSSGGTAPTRLDDDLALVNAIHASGADDETEVTWAALVPHISGGEAKRRLFALGRRIGLDGDALGDGMLGECVDRLKPLLEAAKAELG